MLEDPGLVGVVVVATPDLNLGAALGAAIVGKIKNEDGAGDEKPVKWQE